MPHGPRTDFSQFSLAQLTHMLYDSDPATGVNAAQTWDDTARLLHDQASSLERRLGDFSDKWAGSASDEYKKMVGDLIDGIRKVADTSLRMRDVTYDAVDSLNKARAAMPAPVDVPYVSPSTMALAVTPLPIDSTTPPSVAAQMAADQTRAMDAVNAQQNALSAAAAAHTRAVVVMHTLANNYSGVQDNFPPPPDAPPTIPTGAAPTVTGGLAGPNLSTPTSLNNVALSGADQAGGPGTGPNGGGTPAQNGGDGLFGDLFTVGLAAVAAASAGKFLMPQTNLPKTGTTTGNNGGAGAKVAAGETAGVLGGRMLAAKLGKGGVGGGLGGANGGFGGANGSFGGVGGVDGSAVNAAGTAANSLGSAESAVMSEFSGVGGLAQTAASSGGGSMMPMMPMSGMAGGMGDAAARRIPSWLVETEDVWGASAPVSPGVIGGDL